MVAGISLKVVSKALGCPAGASQAVFSKDPPIRRRAPANGKCKTACAKAHAHNGRPDWTVSLPAVLAQRLALNIERTRNGWESALSARSLLSGDCQAFGRQARAAQSDVGKIPIVEKTKLAYRQFDGALDGLRLLRAWSMTNGWLSKEAHQKRVQSNHDALKRAVSFMTSDRVKPISASM